MALADEATEHGDAEAAEAAEAAEVAVVVAAGAGATATVETSVSLGAGAWHCARIIKGPDNPTSQLLPIMSFKGCSGDGDVRLCQACHVKSRGMSPSATPATQKWRGVTGVTGA